MEPEDRLDEFKVNFTNTEFVVVEDISRLNTDAIILKSTAVLNFSPDVARNSNPRSSTVPFRVSLERLEVSFLFSFETLLLC